MQPQKEKLKAEVVAFFEKEGIGVVAEKVGLSTQALRDIRSGRSAVTLDTLLAFNSAFPDKFGPILTEVLGVKPIEPEPSPAPVQAAAPNSELAEEIILKLTIELEKMSERYDRLEQRYDNTQSRYMHLNDAVMKQRAPDLSFPRSSSQITAMFSEYKQIGFDYCKSVAPEQEVTSQASECIERPMWPHSNLLAFGAALSNPFELLA